MKKIYIIGAVGSGKTTLAKMISKEENIPFYELDNIVWENHINGDIKRSDKDIKKLFKDIINKDKWIIEDVGRDKFIDGVNQADVVIFLNMAKRTRTVRIVRRWIRQKLHLEVSRYKPTLRMLIQMYRWSNNDEKNKKSIIDRLNKYAKKFIILDEKTIKDFKI